MIAIIQKVDNALGLMAEINNISRASNPKKLGADPVKCAPTGLCPIVVVRIGMIAKAIRAFATPA